MKRESLTSVNLNFGTGSNHTASTTSVVGAKDLAPSDSDALGSVVGKLGARVDFSNPQLTKLFSQFIMTERTESKDGVKTIIQRKFTDRISLLLKSHVILVRGKDLAPTGATTFEGLVADFAECPNSPVASFGKQGFTQHGAALVIGNIYNEISDTINSTGEKISLVYQSQQFVPELSHNVEYVPSSYIENPDFSNSNIKYGYRLADFRFALNKVGVPVVGLPNRTDILFQNSGTLESVIGSIASSLGMFWYVNPLSGTVEFISSDRASSLSITNPLKISGENIIDCSFTESALAPIIINSYMATTSLEKISHDISERQRVARFRPIDFASQKDKYEMSFDDETLGIYYGAAAAGALNELTFDTLSFTSEKEPKFGKFFPKFNRANHKEEKKWDELIVEEKSRKDAKDNYKGSFDLEKGKFIPTKLDSGKWNDMPSKSQAFEAIKQALGLLVNKFYVSNAYSDWKVKRMQFSSSDVNISGPYPSDTQVKNIEGLSKLAAIIKVLKKEEDDQDDKTPELTVGDLASMAGCSGLGDYHFIGIKAEPNLNTPVKSNDYAKFSKKNIELYTTPTSLTYLGIQETLFDNLEKIIDRSEELYKVRKDKNLLLDTIRCPYTRTKVPVNELYSSDGTIDREEEDSLDKSDSGSGKSEGQIKDLFDKFNYVKTSLKLNGATGDVKNPVSLDIKQGKGAEVNALMAANFGQRASGKNLASSSRTLVGLVIPTFSIVISGISISLGGSGITTTITESTKKLLPVDTDIVVGDHGKATKTTSSGLSGLSAGQRNTLGL